MKKVIPLGLFGGLLVGLLAYQLWHSGPVVDLTPYVRGEVAKFEVFESAKPVPETPFYNREGQAFQFSDFRGKTLLVNFWATWCEPCKEEMPTLQALQAKIAGDNFQIITVSIDWQGFEVMDPFFKDYKISLLDAFWDNSGRLPNELETIGLPLTILINEKGEWIGRVDGPLVWDSPEAIELFKAASGGPR